MLIFLGLFVSVLFKLLFPSLHIMEMILCDCCNTHSEANFTYWISEIKWTKFSISSRALRLNEKFSFSSRGTRLKETKSRSHLESKNRHLVTLWVILVHSPCYWDYFPFVCILICICLCLLVFTSIVSSLPIGRPPIVVSSSFTLIGRQQRYCLRHTFILNLHKFSGKFYTIRQQNTKNTFNVKTERRGLLFSSLVAVEVTFW